MALYLGESPVVRALRSLIRDRLTLSGRALFWLFLLTNATGMVSFVVKIYALWCILASLLLISMIASRLARVSLQVQVQMPERVTAGQTFTVPVQVSNPTRRRALDVFIRPLKGPSGMEWEPEDGCFIEELLPEESLSSTWRMRVARRGHYLFPGVRQDTVFPWGLWRDLRRIPQERALLVYPEFAPLVSLDIPVGRRYQPGGIALTSNLGDSTEFVSTREFRQGDSIRTIAWRSWARTGEPVVKEFQEEFFCRVALLLDTFQTERGDAGVFEAAVSLAAAVADSLSREEYVIDVFAAGPEIYHFQAGRSLAYLENVLDILACLEPCHEPPFEKVEPVLLECLENITTTVVVMLDWDEARSRMLRVIRDRGSAVKAILVRDQSPTQDLAGLEALVGDYVWVGSEQVRSGGVRQL